MSSQLDQDKSLIHEGNWILKIINVGKWYLFANFFTKGIGVFLLPILTAYLSVKEYGLLHTITSIALLLPFLLSLSLESAFGRFFHDHKDNKENLAKLFSTIFWFILGFGTVIIVLIISTAHYWSLDLLNIKPFPLLYLAFIPIIFLQLSNLGIVFLQQTLDSKIAGFIQVIGSLFKLLSILPLLVLFSFGIKAVLIGNAISSFSIFLMIFFFVKKKGVLKNIFDKNILEETLLYSLPLLPGVAFTWINSMVDRLVIAKYDSLEGVGIYTFAFQIGLILYFVGDAITRVINPMGVSGFVDNKEEVKSKLVATSLNLLAVMSFTSLCGMFFSQEAVWLLGNEAYTGAIFLIPIVLLPAIWGMQNRFFIIVITYYKKTWMITLTAMAAAMVNLILNLIYVPKFGYIVGAFTTVISSLVYFFLTCYFSQSLFKIRYELKRSILILLVLAIAFTFYLKFILIHPYSLKILVIKCIILLFFGYIFIRLGKIKLSLFNVKI